MIQVPVGPNHPVRLAQPSKHRMRGELGAIPERRDQDIQFRAIAFPIRRRSPAQAWLQFRPGRDALRPLHRRPQRDPLDHGPLQDVGRRARVFFPGGDAKRIVQMADHLMRRHPAPLRRGQRINARDPFTATGLRIGIGKRTHRVDGGRGRTRTCDLLRVKQAL
jgi:hypothetical protein